MIRTKQQLISTLRRAGSTIIATHAIIALAIIYRIMTVPRVSRVLDVGIVLLVYAGFMLFTGWQLLTTAKNIESGGVLLDNSTAPTPTHRPSAMDLPAVQNLVTNLRGVVAAERKNAAELQQPMAQPGEELTLDDPRLNTMSNDELVKEMKAMLAEFVRRGN